MNTRRSWIKKFVVGVASLFSGHLLGLCKSQPEYISIEEFPDYHVITGTDVQLNGKSILFVNLYKLSSNGRIVEAQKREGIRNEKGLWVKREIWAGPTKVRDDQDLERHPWYFGPAPKRWSIYHRKKGMPVIEVHEYHNNTISVS